MHEEAVVADHARLFRPIMSAVPRCSVCSCLFSRWLARGKHSISYRIRAEIPGTFSALPARAEAMYAPELKGNSDEIRLVIGE